MRKGRFEGYMRTFHISRYQIYAAETTNLLDVTLLDIEIRRDELVRAGEVQLLNVIRFVRPLDEVRRKALNAVRRSLDTSLCLSRFAY